MELELRRITDIEELMLWRAEVILNVFGEEASDELLDANRSYYEKHIPDGSHLAFVALIEGEDSGCGSVCLYDELPSPDNPDGKCGYLMNIYVREKFRQHGIAHAIVRKLIEVARDLGCEKIYLETTPEGRGVYESLGFKDMPDMMKYKQLSTD